jgi:ParB-like chromosome segregation protein Spo0J
MSSNIVLVKANYLKPHEEISKLRLRRVKDQLLKTRYLRNPVVADKSTLVVLDGHHRLAALKDMGITRIPVFLINYHSKQVRVYSRKPAIQLTNLKQVVIRRGLTGNLFPCKTTKHLIKNRQRNINFKLKTKTKE